MIWAFEFCTKYFAEDAHWIVSERHERRRSGSQLEDEDAECPNVMGMIVTGIQMG